MHPSPGVGKTPRSDYALLGEAFDVALGIAEQPGEDVLVVFAIAGRAAIEGTADMGGSGAELHRQFRNRPGSDLRSCHFRQPMKMRKLRIVVAAILRRLADAGGNRRRLQ